MNRKKSKRLRKQADDMVVSWLKTLVPEGEDQERINKHNISSFLPEEEYYYAHNTRYLHSLTPRWIYQKLKRNPRLTIEEVMNA